MSDLSCAKIVDFVISLGMVGDITFEVSSTVFAEFVAYNAIPDNSIFMHYYGGKITLKRRPTTEERLAKLEAKLGVFP